MNKIRWYHDNIVLCDGVFLCYGGFHVENLMIPVIETERLFLRAVGFQDIDDMFEYASDAETVKELTFPAHKDKDDTRDSIENIFLKRPERGNPEAFAIVLKDSGKMIGTCDFFKGYGSDTYEMGYVLNKKYWRKGITYEAAKAVLDYAFNTFGVRRMMIRHLSENSKSEGLIRKLGFIYEGELRKAILNKNGSYSNLKMYSMFKEELK